MAESVLTNTNANFQAFQQATTYAQQRAQAAENARASIAALIPDAQAAANAKADALIAAGAKADALIAAGAKTNAVAAAALLPDLRAARLAATATAGLIPHSGGDHTTIPAGAGVYRIMTDAEAGQVWERVAGGGVLRRPELEAAAATDVQEARALAQEADTKAGTASNALGNLDLTTLATRTQADGPQLADGSRWVWSASGTVNGGTVVAAAGSGVWSREVTVAAIMPERYGAVSGDAGQITAALRSKRRVELPVREHYIGEALTIRQAETLTGVSGSDSTPGSRLIVPAGAIPAGQYALTIAADTTTQGSAVRNDQPLRDVSLAGPGGAGARPHGIRMQGALGSVRNVHLHGFADAFTFDTLHCFMNTLYDFHAFANRAGLVVGQGIDSGEKQTVMTGVINNNDVGIRLDGGLHLGLYLYNVSLDYNVVPIQINYEISEVNDSPYLVFDGGWWESNVATSPGPFIQLSPAMETLRQANPGKVWKLPPIIVHNVKLQEIVSDNYNPAKWFAPGILGTIIFRDCRDHLGRVVNTAVSSWFGINESPTNGAEQAYYGGVSQFVTVQYRLEPTTSAEAYINVYGGRPGALTLRYQITRPAGTGSGGLAVHSFILRPGEAFRLDWERATVFSHTAEVL